jgi:DNA-binding MarR family transcriptional regulator
VSVDPILAAERLWMDHGWEDSAAGMRLITTLTRAQQLLHQRIDALLKPDLTFARYEILMLLTFSRRGELPMSIVSDRLQVHAASVTSAVERLERDGYVDRVRDADDRRRVLARLTPQGKKRAHAATRLLNEEVFSHVPAVMGSPMVVQRDLDALRQSLGDSAAVPTGL